jgi:large subunit ribosomal protein L9
MEVILKQDVPKLGYTDDVVKVKNGYGRNYLIPQGFAVISNETNRKVHEEIMRQRAFKAEKIKNEADQMAEKLASTNVSIGAKVGDSGKIFGSVTSIQIADALKKLGFAIDRKSITLNTDHIKTPGTYTANIHLHKGVDVILNFEVVAE